MLVSNFIMYISSSFIHITIREVSLSTWIATSFIKYKQIVLTVCIWSCLQSFITMVVSFSSYKRISINPYWISTSFTLTCYREKLLFLLYQLIFTLIEHVFFIFFNLDQYCHNLDNLMLCYPLLGRIPHKCEIRISYPRSLIQMMMSILQQDERREIKKKT